MEDHNLTPPPVPPVQEPPPPGPSSREPLQEPPLHDPPVRGPSDDIPPLKPSNWLWQSIVVTILCCNPLGIVGIVYAARVNSLYYSGQYDQAARAARNARMWAIIAFVTGLIYYIVVIIQFATGSMPEYMKDILENNPSGYNF